MDGMTWYRDEPARADLRSGSDLRTGFVLTAAITAATAGLVLLSSWGGTTLLAPTLDAASLFLG